MSQLEAFQPSPTVVDCKVSSISHDVFFLQAVREHHSLLATLVLGKGDLMAMG